MAHSGLQTFGRVIGFFLLFLFVSLVPVFVILFGVSRTLLSESYLKAHLTDGTVRTEVLGIVQQQLSGIASDEQGSPDQPHTQSSVVSSPAVKTILSNAVSESTFNTVIDTALTNGFAFLRGDVKFADIKIETKDLQKSVLTGLQDSVLSLPVCGPNEASILDQGDTNNEENVALCKPRGASDEQLKTFVHDPQFTSMITENIPATYKLSELPNFEEINYQATQVRHYYSELTRGIVYGGIALVLALIIGSFLWHQHLWYGLQTLGMTLFIPLISLAGLAFFGDQFVSRLVINNTFSQDPTATHAVAIGWYLIQPMLAYILEICVVSAVFGLILFVVMEVVRHVAAKRNSEGMTAQPATQAKPKKLAKKRS